MFLMCEGAARANVALVQRAERGPDLEVPGTGLFRVFESRTRTMDFYFMGARKTFKRTSSYIAFLTFPCLNLEV